MVGGRCQLGKLDGRPESFCPLQNLPRHGGSDGWLTTSEASNCILDRGTEEGVVWLTRAPNVTGGPFWPGGKEVTS